jgi:hypothetical protein
VNGLQFGDLNNTAMLLENFPLRENPQFFQPFGIVPRGEFLTAQNGHSVLID